jgi:hypothetical protein
VPIKATGKASFNEWIQNDQSLRKHAAESDLHSRRARTSQHPRMEEALFIRFKQTSDRELGITDEILFEKPMKLESSQMCLTTSTSHVAGFPIGRSDMVCVSLWDMGRLLQLLKQEGCWQESQCAKRIWREKCSQSG